MRDADAGAGAEQLAVSRLDAFCAGGLDRGEAARGVRGTGCADQLRVSISTATVVPASNDAPKYCRVFGFIQPEVRFDVSLPAAWNGRLYMFGNGGYAGESLDAQGRVATARRALARGFAVAQMNAGHDAAVEPLGTFASSPQKLLDYGFRAVHVTATTAKKIVGTFCGGALRHSTSTAARPAVVRV